MLTVARRGKKKLNLEPEALAVLTSLINLLAQVNTTSSFSSQLILTLQETLARTAQSAANTGNRHVTREHLRRVIAQIMLDFAV
uniref:Centromere protein X n=1 Tax=Caenorhabditis tropicalis TaxID=1561998 RepID=A0A1I7UB42_9PELO